ncbi:MAG TPA: YciI family protein [Candidatus Elarobacter sp.]|jgi:hypothetical protein
MKFISIWKVDARLLDGPGPTQENMQQMGQLIGEMTQAGVLVDTGGVMQRGAALRVRRTGPKVSVTDGPFTETKEVVGGFAILNVASKEDAIAWTRRFVEAAGDGEAELHELAEY